MVVCRYYLEGRCAFGDKCRFDHPVPFQQQDYTTQSERFSYSQQHERFDNPQQLSDYNQPIFSYHEQRTDYPQQWFDYHQQPSVNHKQQSGSRHEHHKQKPGFAQQQTTQTARTDSLQSLNLFSSTSFLRSKDYEIMLEDVICAERGHQWPLSCYAPFRGRQNIPTMEDTSFEELRHIYVQKCKQDPSNKEYISSEKRLFEKANLARKFLKEPTVELAKMLTNLGAWDNLENQAAANPPKTSSSFSTFKFVVDPPDSGNRHALSSTTAANVFSEAPSQTSSIFASAKSTESVSAERSSQKTKGPEVDTKADAENSGVYSKEEDLTREEIKSFSDPTFSFMKIPLKPPPKAFCFPS